jgi:hypothetical protein
MEAKEMVLQSKGALMLYAQTTLLDPGQSYRQSHPGVDEAKELPLRVLCDPYAF